MQTCYIKKAILFLLFVCLVSISCTLDTTSSEVYPNNNVTPSVPIEEIYYPSISSISYVSVNEVKVNVSSVPNNYRKVSYEKIAIKCFNKEGVSIPLQNVEKNSSNSNEVTFTFDEIIYDKEVILYFILTDGKETYKTEEISSYVFNNTLGDVTNLKANYNGEWNYTVSWDREEGYSYDVRYGRENGKKQYDSVLDNEASYSVYTKDITDTYFEVRKRRKGDNGYYECSPYVGLSLAIQKEDVDVLIVMYMDGDNSLNNLISKDLGEAVQGISSLTSNVEALILFDGDTSSDSVLKRAKSGNSNVIDISDKTLFIGNEVNMGSPNTMKDLLQWVKAHYSYKSIILQVSNHGGGPRSININNNSRLICQDETSNNAVLFSKDIPRAIKESNIGIVDLVIQDVCFGSAVEEVYEYKDVAKYMLLSPNEMPGDGLKYDTLLSCLNKGECINEDGKLNTVKFLYNGVNSFKTFYNNFLDWKSIKSYLVSNNIEVTPLNMSIHAANHRGIGEYFMNCPTITAIDVSHVVELKDSVKEIVTLIKNNKSLFNILNKKMYKTKDGKMIEYEKMIQLLFLNFYNSAIMYDSPVGPLYDLGDISQTLYSLTKEKLDSGEANPNYWKEFNTLSEKFITSLDSVVIASWRPGFETGPLYEKGDGTASGIAPYDKGSYGLCVLGPNFLKEENGYRIEFDFNYKDNLSFNTDALWHDLMRLVIYAN